MAEQEHTQTGNNIAVFSYSANAREVVKELMAASGVAGTLNVTYDTLPPGQNGRSDIAVAVLSSGDDIKRYAQDVTSLKVVQHVPAVFAVVTQEMHDLAAEHIADLETDDILYLPVDPAEFHRTVMTHMAAIEIEKQKQTSKVDFNRNHQSFGEILVHNKVISPLQLKKALEYQSSSDMRLGDALVLLGYISEQQKLHFLGSQLGVELVTPKQYAAADLNVVALIPEHIARRSKVLAVKKEADVLTVAMLDPLNLKLLDTLRDITGLTIRPVLGNEEDIATSVERYYRDISSQRDASDLMAGLGDDVEIVSKDTEEVDLEEATAAGAELGIVKLVNMLISNAVRDRASDIHIEPQEKELLVRYRIDGELRRVMSPPQRSHQAIITRIKILSNLDIAERRLPQDGRMVVRMGHKEIDIRVSILPTVFGEKAVLRILDKEAFEKSITNLGFTQNNLEIFRHNISKPYGMIIVTGPTGSGKSTTLYSAIQAIRSVTKNIITAEDPVEFHMEGISQVHVNTKIGLTFGNVLRSILRQDPDIVLIGEIRDAETADIAIKMALTGHLVFSTLHTNDAASSIARFVDIGIPPLLLGSSLNLIVAQRLVRRVCTKCKVEYQPEKELLEQLNLEHAADRKFYRGEGCVNCNGTGYSGRGGLFEMLNVSKEIRTMILRNASTMDIQAQAIKDGMRTLRDAGIEKVLQGETTIEQVIAVTTEI